MSVSRLNFGELGEVARGMRQRQFPRAGSTNLQEIDVGGEDGRDEMK